MEENNPQTKFYSPPATVALTLVIFFGSQLIAGILISIIPMVKGWTDQQISSWLQANAWATFGFIALMQATATLLVYVFLKSRKQGFGFIGLNRLRPKHLVYVLAGYGVYFVLYLVGLVIVKLAVPELDLNQEQDIGFKTTTTGLGLLPVFLSLVILPPLVEEIVARGFLFGGLRNAKVPFALAAVMTSVMFAAAHLNGAKEGLLWVATIDTFILSLVLCYLREKTDSLWPPIGVHMIKNAFAFVVLFKIVDFVG